MYLGDYAEDETIYTMFNTFTSDDPSASCTIADFVNTDVHIHKDDGLIQRNNAAGITVSTNFDGIIGSHMIKIDTNDNTVGGFWVAGHDYFVRIEGTTVDAATINAMVCHFSIENRFMRGTDSAATATALSTHDGKLDTCDGVCDGIQTDLSNATDGLGALKTLIDACNTTTPPTVGEIRTEMEGAGSKILAIEGYTDKIDDATNGLTAIKAEVEGLGGEAMRGTDSAALAATALTDTMWTDAKAGYIDAAITSRSTVTTAQVNTEVVDVLTVDVTAEMAQGAPPATPTFEEMLAYVYFSLRNKVETTATENAVYDNTGATKLFKATVVDDGTTFSKAAYVSGP